MQLLDLLAHPDPQRGIQVRQRFIKQKQFRLLDNRTPDRHTLALPAGQILRQPVQHFFQLQHAGGVSDPLINLGGGRIDIT